MFCFAHLQSCHNGWASNILIVVDTGCADIHQNIGCPFIMTRLKMGETKHPIVYSLNQSLPCQVTPDPSLILVANTASYFDLSISNAFSRISFKSTYPYDTHVTPIHSSPAYILVANTASCFNLSIPNAFSRIAYHVTPMWYPCDTHSLLTLPSNLWSQPVS